MDPREHWQAVYEAKRPDEVSWYQPSPEPSLGALDRLGVGPDASLIDVGGGASPLAGELVRRGWGDVTVLDIAGSALAASRKQLADIGQCVRWVEADIRIWRPDRTYDVWHDRAVFHFLTEAQDRTSYHRALLAATGIGSHVVVATFAPDGPDKCSGLPVRRYSADEIAAELGPAFEPVEAWSETHLTPWGATQSFQWAAFRRA